VRRLSYNAASHVIKDPIGPGYWGFCVIEYDTGETRAVWARGFDGQSMTISDTPEEADEFLTFAIIEALEDHYGEDVP